MCGYVIFLFFESTTSKSLKNPVLARNFDFKILITLLESTLHHFLSIVAALSLQLFLVSLSSPTPCIDSIRECFSMSTSFCSFTSYFIVSIRRMFGKVGRILVLHSSTSGCCHLHTATIFFSFDAAINNLQLPTPLAEIVK